MATRKIDTRIARDSRWKEMPIRVRYLWFYLLTTDFSQIIGIFYLPLDMVAAETNLGIDEVKQYLMTLTDMKLLLFSPDTSEIIIFNYPKFNIFGWNKYIKTQIENELSNIKNLNLIKIMRDTLNSFILERTNDKVRSSFLNEAMSCCDRALRPYEKEKSTKEKDLDVDKDVDLDKDLDVDINIIDRNEEKDLIEKSEWEKLVQAAKTPWLRDRLLKERE